MPRKGQKREPEGLVAETQGTPVQEHHEQALPETPTPQVEAPAPKNDEQRWPPRSEGSKPPVHTIRIGRLWCKIWKNHHPQQGDWYAVRITRSFKDADGHWRSSDTMGRDDLLPHAELSRLAFHWITQELQKYDRD